MLAVSPLHSGQSSAKVDHDNMLVATDNSTLLNSDDSVNYKRCRYSFILQCIVVFRESETGQWRLDGWYVPFGSNSAVGL